MSTQVHSGPNMPTSEIGEPNSEGRGMDRSTSDRSLLRIAAVAVPVGIVLEILMEALHPSKADPNDSAAAFQEYAASNIWTIVHIGQFFAALLVALALVTLARSLARQSGVAGALAVIGGVTAILVAAVFAVQMAVDGVALKATIDTWTSASQAGQGERLPSGGGDTRARKGPQRILPPRQRHDTPSARAGHRIRTQLSPLARLGRRSVRPGLPRRRGCHGIHRVFIAGRHGPPRPNRPRCDLPARCCGVHVAQKQHRAIAGPQAPQRRP